MDNKRLIIPATEFFNAQKLIIEGFGLPAVRAKIITIPDNEVLQNESDANNEIEDSDDNYLGAPVWDTLTLLGGNYDTNNLPGATSSRISFNSLTIGCVFMEITQGKNIVRTAIQGRNGRIKEYISDDDYSISIKGVLVGNGLNVFPADLVERWVAICKAPISIGVASNLLNYFNITNIVVNEYTFTQTDARNVVQISMSCFSEPSYEINVVTNNK